MESPEKFPVKIPGEISAEIPRKNLGGNPRMNSQLKKKSLKEFREKIPEIFKEIPGANTRRNS